MLATQDYNPRGTRLSVKELAGLRHLARKLVFGQSRQHTAVRQGSHESRLRGRGLEFREVREYQPGDDIRHIDWRVTARTSTAHTKVFQEEQERPGIICLDLRQSMYFGSRRCFKHVCAGHAAALLAWSSLHRGDRVGALLFNDTGHRELRPRRSSKSVMHMIAGACDYDQMLPAKSGSADLAQTFEELRRITRPGSTVYIVSDFYGLSTGAEKHLSYIARHNDVIAVSITDPLEREFAATGDITLTDGDERLQLAVDRRFQAAFRNQRAQFDSHLEAVFRRARIRHIPLSCGEPVFSPLLEGLRR